MTIYLLSYAGLLAVTWWRKAKHWGRHSRGVPLPTLVELSPEPDERFPGGAHRAERLDGTELQGWAHRMVEEHRTGGHRRDTFEGVIPPLAFLQDEPATLYYETAAEVLVSRFDEELLSFTHQWTREYVDQILAAGAPW